MTLPNKPTADIHLEALRHNLAVVRDLAPHSKVMAVIKADAYGHGIVEVATALSTGRRPADALAVARLDEAISLRQAGINQRLVIMSGLLSAEDLALCAHQSLDIVIHDRATAEILIHSELSSPLNVWLKLDSGMHRLGVDSKDYISLHQQLSDSPNTAELILMSHFSSADETELTTSEQQISTFDTVTSGLSNPVSLANSAAIMQLPDSHRDWVRPGIMLYGANPLQNTLSFGRSMSDRHKPIELKPVMTLTASVVSIRQVNEGEAVGYNQRWVAQHNSLIATIGMGYGDGYPRHAANGTPVWINDQQAPLVGTVSMDLITVDVTDCGPVNIGDRVTLWGNHLPVETIANQADTISYELFTSVTNRVSRSYT